MRLSSNTKHPPTHARAAQHARPNNRRRPARAHPSREPDATWRPPSHRPRVSARVSAPPRAQRFTRTTSSAAMGTTRAESTINGVEAVGSSTNSSDGSWTSRARKRARRLETSRSSSSRCFSCSVDRSVHRPMARRRRARARGVARRRRRRTTCGDSTAEAVERRARA